MDQQQTGNPTGNSRSVRCCSTICRSGCKASVPSKTRMRCKTLIRSLPWKGLMIVFYTFVLFGNPLYLLCSIDEMVYDILAGVTFVFCVVEMILRILAEPGYMKIDIVLVGSNRFLLSGSEPNKALPLGSFLFWCDLFSSGVILYHIIWINAATGRLKTVEIFLDSDGLPDHDFADGRRIRAAGLEIWLLITIARCARAARFIRSRTVVNAGNFLNCYWVFKRLHFLNPFYYYKRFKSRRVEEAADGTTAMALTEKPRLKKNHSWGALQLGVLAAVRAHADPEVETNDRGMRMWKILKRQQSLRSKPDYDSRRRHLAAIKIQRAWRSFSSFGPAASGDDESGFGDAPIEEDMYMASHRSVLINPLDRAQTKRSMLPAFSHMNAHGRGKLDLNDIQASTVEDTAGSRFQSKTGSGDESQVGTYMRGLTGQRVAVGVLLAILFTSVFTYTEPNSTRSTAMVVLHRQTLSEQFRMKALNASRTSSVPSMYLYKPVDEDAIRFPVDGVEQLKDRERIRYVVQDSSGRQSAAEFNVRDEIVNQAIVEIVTIIFIVLVWFFGVLSFTGPVSSLVVIPIERMVKLLGMLMMDPLGYQSTQRFKSFLIEEQKLIDATGWTKEVLRGMETSFLMSTILRIGSLMKVGFGTAGVEIIRNNLLMGQSKNMLVLTAQGSTVSCIFLFCDIRQFTDATECLQEEVFVFTNRIAAVVHSICHSYGGAANKNVGDAFLLSWSLEDEKMTHRRHSGPRPSHSKESRLNAKNNQADKALLSVIKICISLYYDHFYLKPLSEAARGNLKDKLKKRSGPVVQMGFGLHAGKAVQGAIGSQRKIDATYVSEAVERAEFLESSTKQYGLKLLMSGSFHKLLHPNNRRRCRKIDRVLLQDDEDSADEDDYLGILQGELMELFTFDMDVAAIHRPAVNSRCESNDSISDRSGSLLPGTPELPRKQRRIERRSNSSSRQVRHSRRGHALQRQQGGGSDEFVTPNSNPENSIRGTGSLVYGGASILSQEEDSHSAFPAGIPELVLPTGHALYSHNIWQSPDMKKIRERFVEGLFFPKYQAGLQAYYAKDWELARQCFEIILENFDDGPSKYFMDKMMENNWIPPKDFLEYSLA